MPYVFMVAAFAASDNSDTSGYCTLSSEVQYT